MASLANILGKIENLGGASRTLKEYELQPIEISLGLIQLSEALHFCHAEAQLIYGNLTPGNHKNIFIV